MSTWEYQLVKKRKFNFKLLSWTLLNLLFLSLFIILFSISYSAPFDLKTPYDINSVYQDIISEPKKVEFLSSLQLIKMGAYFFLIFYLFFSLYYLWFVFKNKSRFIQKDQFYWSLYSIFGIPIFISLYYHIEEFLAFNKQMSWSEFLETQKNNDLILFGKKNLFLTISTIFLVIAMILYRSVEGIIYIKNSNSFSYKSSTLIAWPFEYLTSLANHLVLIYIICFCIFRNYKFFNSTKLATFCISYLTFVGLVYNVILFPDYLKENHHPFSIFNNIVKHIISVICAIVFLISLYCFKSKSSLCDKKAYLKLETSIFSFGIPYLIYVFAIPFFINYSMYKITNLNPNAWIISAAKVASGSIQNILWIFISLLLIFIISSIFFLIELLIVKKYQKKLVLDNQ